MLSLELVNRDLATASTVDADATEFQAAGGSLWFKYSDWSEYGIELWSFIIANLKLRPRASLRITCRRDTTT
jgi:alpha-2-macroglobulin